MKTTTALCMSIALATFLTACKKEKKYDECGNEICADCGGVGLTAQTASGIILIIADDVHDLADPITVWNTDNAQQYRVITQTTRRGTEGGECATGLVPSNYPHYRIPPGATLNWRARNNSGTFDKSGSIRNPDCLDGQDCYYALLEEL